MIVDSAAAAVAAGRRFCRALAVALLLLAAATLPGAAAGPPASSASEAAPEAAPPVSAAELQRLVGTLQDEKARARLVEELRGLIAVQRGDETAEAKTPAGILNKVSARVRTMAEEVLAAAAVVVDAPRLTDWLQWQVSDPGRREVWLEVALKLSVIFGFALVAEWAARTLLVRPRRAVANRVDAKLPVRAAFALLRALFEALPILAFAAVAYGVMPLTSPRFQTAKVAQALIDANVTVRVIMAVARTFLAPDLAAALFRLSAETRNYLVIWIRRFAAWAFYGYAVAEAAWWLGVPGSIYSLMLRGPALVLAILGIVFVLQNRAAVAQRLRGRAQPAPAEGERRRGWRMLRNRTADIWHVLAILYIVGIFLVYALRIEGGFIFVARGTAVSLAVIIAARLIVGLARRLARHGFSVGTELKVRFPTLEQRANRYLPILIGVVAALVYGFAALAVLQAWNIEAFAWFGSGVGRQLTRVLLTIGFVLLAALVAWEVIASTIDRYLASVDDAGRPVARSARARTLLPLFRTTLMVLLVVMVALIVLSEIGVNIAPLLAGAGVVGVAIGFGSQALVKDVITGLFILIEDTLAVGDVVDVGKGNSGVVEGLSVRAIRLRDSSGALYTVPFSEVTTVKNLTRDFAYYVINLGVTQRADPDRAMAIMREVAAGLAEDPEFKPLVLAPIEVFGVDRFSETAGVVIQARIKTLPIKQWTVGREFNRRIKKAFDEAGIEMPFAYQQAYLGLPPPDVARQEAEEAAEAEESERRRIAKAG